MICLLRVDFPFGTAWMKHVSLTTAIAEGTKCLSVFLGTALYDFASSNSILHGNGLPSCWVWEQVMPSSYGFFQTQFFFMTFRSFFPTTARVLAGSGAGFGSGESLLANHFFTALVGLVAFGAFAMILPPCSCFCWGKALLFQQK